MSISIGATPPTPIEVTLVDVKYVITPPKAAFAMKMAYQAKAAQNEKDGSEKAALTMIESINEWIVAAFGATKAKAVQKRLDDPKDLLDITHVMELMEAVIEHQTGNPTS